MIQGRNENVPYKGITFHIQTEDRGLANPVIVSTLFYKGMIINEERLSYADILKFDRLNEMIKDLIEELHRKVIFNLKNGLYDEKIRGFVNLLDEETLHNEVLRFFEQELLQGLKQELGIQIGEDTLNSLRKEIKGIGSTLNKETFLSLCALIYKRVEGSCDKEAFKEFIKKWSSTVGKAEKISKEEVKLKELMDHILHKDIADVLGESLTRALIDKVLRELHSSFLHKREAFDIIVQRILNAGIIQKRTTEEWRRQKKSLWTEKYRNILNSSIIHV